MLAGGVSRGTRALAVFGLLVCVTVLVGCADKTTSSYSVAELAETGSSDSVEVHGIITGVPVESGATTTLVLADEGTPGVTISVHVTGALDTTGSLEELDGREFVVTGVWDGQLLTAKYYIIKDVDWSSNSAAEAATEPEPETTPEASAVPATGKVIPFDGAVVTITSVRRVDQSAFGNSGDYLRIDYAVDNTQGIDKVSFSVMNTGIRYSDDRFVSPSGTDQGGWGGVVLKIGEAGSTTQYYNLNFDSVIDNPAVDGPEDIVLYVNAALGNAGEEWHEWDEYEQARVRYGGQLTEAPLSDYWSQPF